jgi:hypothetical protein
MLAAQTELGDYLLLTVDRASDGAGGPPHFVNGMFAELIVE